MQVDLSLHVLPAESDGRPKAGLGYAGLAPEQRYGFLVWAADATEPAALAFQQLYIANLEVRLFEDVQQLARVHAELLRLDAVDTWHGLDFLSRVVIEFLVTAKWRGVGGLDRFAISTGRSARNRFRVSGSDAY